MHAYTLSKLCPTLKKNTCKLAARATSERIGQKVFNNALKTDFENLLGFTGEALGAGYANTHTYTGTGRRQRLARLARSTGSSSFSWVGFPLWLSETLELLILKPRRQETIEAYIFWGLVNLGKALYQNSFFCITQHVLSTQHYVITPTAPHPRQKGLGPGMESKLIQHTNSRTP